MICAETVKTNCKFPHNTQSPFVLYSVNLRRTRTLFFDTSACQWFPIHFHFHLGQTTHIDIYTRIAFAPKDSRRVPCKLCNRSDFYTFSTHLHSPVYSNRNKIPCSPLHFHLNFSTSSTFINSVLCYPNECGVYDCLWGSNELLNEICVNYCLLFNIRHQISDSIHCYRHQIYTLHTLRWTLRREEKEGERESNLKIKLHRSEVNAHYFASMHVAHQCARVVF